MPHYAGTFYRAVPHVPVRGVVLAQDCQTRFYGAAGSRDVDAAVKFLSETKGIRRISLIGHSAGAISAILSAVRNPQGRSGARRFL